MPRGTEERSTRERSRARRDRAPKARSAAAGAASILAWQDDPGEPTAARQPISRPAPNLAAPPLPISIRGRAPAPRVFKLGTPGFRYWANAEAVARGAAFWASILPKGTTWYPSNGSRLPVQLDDGVDLNAYYDRNGLHFFHDTVNGITFYSGESPDVACHELGHAILDALRPQLWDAMSAEIAAFHESFGDMSAMLSALQLDVVRSEALAETSSHLDRSSRLSRLAEQLGWAIRQGHPDAVDSDCLRNASNSFFYTDPTGLPPRAPATQLSSEPHSFSRVFTGAFLDVLAAMFLAQPAQNEAALLDSARDLAQILVAAVAAAPVVPTYYSQVAAHMLAVDSADFGGRYRDALKSGLVAHGVLSLQSATAPPPPQTPRGARRALATIAVGIEEMPLTRIALPAAHLGLAEDLLVSAASQPKRFAVGGAAADLGDAESPAHDKAAASFLEDLVRRGRIDFASHAIAESAVIAPHARKSHEITRDQGQLVLIRRHFDCGFHVT